MCSDVGCFYSIVYMVIVRKAALSNCQECGIRQRRRFLWGQPTVYQGAYDSCSTIIVQLIHLLYLPA